jgi:predicted metal-dependent hydrolase
MKELLQVGKFPIEVEYKSVKTLRMTVYPPARIAISAPLRTSRRYIQDFVISKTAWIEKNFARFRRTPPGDAPLQNDAPHQVWGIAYRLEIIERQGRPKIVLVEGSGLGEGRMQLFIRPGEGDEKQQQYLDKWYRKLLKETAAAVVGKWEARVGVKVRQIYYRKMKTHWGSCNYVKKTIRLNTELAKKPPECLDYVVLHELIHILEPSHNRNFYQLMDRFLPNWKIIRRKMNKGEL